MPRLRSRSGCTPSRIVLPSTPFAAAAGNQKPGHFPAASCFRIRTSPIKKLTAGAQDRYETSEALFQAVVKRLDLDPEKLRRSILANLYVNSDVSEKEDQKRDDSELREFIKSWKAVADGG